MEKKTFQETLPKPEILTPPGSPKDEPKKTKPFYVLEETVLESVEIDKNLMFRLIDNANGRFIDIRKFYKGFPTKKGVRFSYATYKKLKNMINF